MNQTTFLRALSTTLFVTCCLSLTVASGQDPTATTQPADTPADRQPVPATVIEVQGDVEYSPLDQSDWKPCEVGAEYPQETVIRTGIHSSVMLQIGSEEPYTALIIDSASKVILSESFKTAETKRVRVGLGYGSVRAGVAEGGLKSDFTVDSPVATLSKRGTWNFGMFYERGTERFEIFLLDRGLVEALNKITKEQRTVQKGQAVTQAMRRWFKESQIRRNVPIPDLLGQGDIEIAFNRMRQDGLGVVDPAGGQTVLIDLSHDLAQQHFAQLARNRIGNMLRSGPHRGPYVRPEGFFGTGRGDQLIPLVIEANSPLVQKGFARPGQYKFRRSVLEGWLKRHGGKP